MLNYDAQKNAFKRVHQETFGKSGVRRTVPGQYLATDPKGRCCMLASVEKNKVVYIVNRNSEGDVLISSPHEANQWASLCFAVCALDTGWEHPIFACLEVDYNDLESDPSGEMFERREKQLVYYTVDLGLNHVVKSWSDTVDYSANMVFGVPGGADGPSGAIVCCDGRLYYRHDKNSPLSIPIPRRQGATEDPNRKRCIVAGCLHLSRQRKDFFLLLQTEDGDVFKLTMTMATDAQGRTTSQPERLNLRYYETLPVAKQMLLIKKGYLYIAAENGNNRLYHVNDLADDAAVEPYNSFSSEDCSADPDAEYTPTYFTPRNLLFISLAADVPGLNPLMRTQVDNPLNEDAPQIYALQGSGNSSVFKTIRHGLEVVELVSSALGNMIYDNLWPLKHRSSDTFHSYLLLSSTYADQTIVLSIGDEVETMDDSPFLTSRATVAAQLMGDTTLVQVHPRGVHSVYENGTVNEWPSPAHRTIVAGSGNERQLLLGLSSSELAFFFMGDDCVLNQLEEMPEMSGQVTALAVGQTPRGREQAKYAVVGCDDCTIRVLSIELDSPLEVRSVQALSAVPSSVEVIEQLDPGSGTVVSYVHIGLQSGLYLRAVIDDVTGELGEVRTKFLGAKATRLFPVEVGEDTSGVLACSSRPWLGYNHPQSQMYTLTPLVTAALETARPFVSEHIRGLCALQGSNLFIFEMPSIGGRLSSSEVKLNYTPRAMSRNPYFPIWYVVQSDGNTLSKATRQELLANGTDTKMKVEGNGEAEEEEVSPEELERHVGLSRATGHWASCISAVDPVEKKAITTNVELTENEAALCVAVVPFAGREYEYFLAVGTGQHMQPGAAAAQLTKGLVHVYRITEEGKGLEFYHTVCLEPLARGLWFGMALMLIQTEFDVPIYALMAFQGKLAVGVGTELFVFDLGLKALLRKSRGTVVPNQIVSLQAMGNRIVCGDVSESATFVVYKPKANRMIPFVDDSIQRWTTATTMIDYESAAGGDKFGNLWVVRCPDQASKEADEEGIGGFIVNERSYLGGAPYRLELRAHFFAQDIPTSLQRTSLVAGGQEVLFWSGLQGTLGILIPFLSREDVEFFAQLEQLIRAEEPPLAGRDHLMYRSYYVPVKGVVDGDLCERFMKLGVDGKQKIAGEVERSVREVERKVQEMRTRVAF